MPDFLLLVGVRAEQKYRLVRAPKGSKQIFLPLTQVPICFLCNFNFIKKTRAIKQILISITLIAQLCGQLNAQTWETLSVPTTKDVISSSFINDVEGWIGTVNTGSYAIIFHTTDGGATWNADTIDNASGGSTYVCFADSSNGYSVVNAKAFKTADAGLSWSEMSIPGIPYYKPYFLNSDTGFIAGSGEVFKTTDGGNTWTDYPLDAGGVIFTDLHFLNDSTGAGSELEGDTYGTADGGETWFTINDGGLWSYYSCVWYTPDGDYLEGGYTDVFGDHYVTIGGGGNIYTSYNLYNILDLRFTNDLKGFAVGTTEGIVFSTKDGGITWEEETLTSQPLYVLDGFSDVYAFGKKGKAFKLPYSCAPSAAFSYVATDLEVHFTDLSDNATSWFWDFDDGNTSTEKNPTHTYTEGGTYKVCLESGSDTCGSDKYCFKINVCEPNSSLSTAGTLDSDFEDDGIVITPFYAGAHISSVAVQSDGKVIAAANSAYADIIRYNVDGTKDSSFSDDGILNVNLLTFTLKKILSDQDDRILAGGFLSTNEKIVLLRYLTDGTPDASFGSDGKVETEISQTGAGNYFITFGIQPDSKIVLVGYYYSGSGLVPTVVRYNHDGSLDTGFAGGGISQLEDIDVIPVGDGIALQADGKILVSSLIDKIDDEFAVFRLNENGSPDSTFDGDGLASINVNIAGFGYESPSSVEVLADGRIMVSGTSDLLSAEPKFAIVRFNSDGSPDSSFNGTGILKFQIEDKASYCNSAALQPDGKLILAGYNATFVGEEKIALARLDTSGIPDPSFGNEGVLVTHINCLPAIGGSLALSPGKIHLSGTSFSDYVINDKVILLRYINDCPPGGAQFSYASSGLDIQFTDQSISATSWFWDFGDGATSTEQNPVHAYSLPGTYTVCLVATNACSSDTLCQEITLVVTANSDASDDCTTRLKVSPVINNGRFKAQYDCCNSGEVKFTVVDLYGTVVHSTIAQGTRLATVAESFDLAALPAGLYLLEAKNGSVISRQKVIILR
jgi:uncharacterized delta-60 repeat protein